MRAADVYAAADETDLNVAVSSAPGSAGAAIANTSVSSRVQIVNRNAGCDIDYRVGLGDWQTLSRDQGRWLEVNLAATSVMLRKASPVAGSVMVKVLIEGAPVLVGSSGVIAPAITAAPSITGTPTSGSPVAYTAATASGTPSPLVAHDIVIDGASFGASYTPTGADTGKAVVVRAVAMNLAGQSDYATSAPAVVGGSSATAPSITTQPSGQTVTAGATATFSVVAVGTAPLSYQWRKGGTPISGATSASYTTPATVTGDSGSLYSVVVSNSVNSVTSLNAALTVNAADTTAPTFVSAAVSNGTPNVISVTLSEALVGTLPAASAFPIGGAAASGKTVRRDSQTKYPAVPRDSIKPSAIRRS